MNICIKMIAGLTIIAVTMLATVDTRRPLREGNVTLSSRSTTENNWWTIIEPRSTTTGASLIISNGTEEPSTTALNGNTERKGRDTRSRPVPQQSYPEESQTLHRPPALHYQERSENHKAPHVQTRPWSETYVTFEAFANMYLYHKHLVVFTIYQPRDYNPEIAFINQIHGAIQRLLQDTSPNTCTEKDISDKACSP